MKKYLIILNIIIYSYMILMILMIAMVKYITLRLLSIYYMKMKLHPVLKK